MNTKTTGQVQESFLLSIQGRKYIKPHSREQNFRFPVVPKLEDFREREIS
jgi:hypothetical protein